MARYEIYIYMKYPLIYEDFYLCFRTNWIEDDMGFMKIVNTNFEPIRFKAYKITKTQFIYATKDMEFNYIKYKKITRGFNSIIFDDNYKMEFINRFTYSNEDLADLML